MPARGRLDQPNAHGEDAHRRGLDRERGTAMVSARDIAGHADIDCVMITLHNAVARRDRREIGVGRIANEVSLPGHGRDPLSGVRGSRS